VEKRDGNEGREDRQTVRQGMHREKERERKKERKKERIKIEAERDNVEREPLSVVIQLLHAHTSLFVLSVLCVD